MNKPVSEDNMTNNDYNLSNSEKDALGEIGNICMGSCATTLSTLLGKRVTITTPKVSLCKRENIFDGYEKPLIVAQVAYIKGVEGNNVFLVKKEDALLMTDLLMGSDGSSPEEELKEYYLSATSEVMNQMVGSSATSLADILQTDINISPPQVTEVSKEDNFSGVSFEDETFIKVSFRMEIEGLIVSNIMNLMSYDFGKSLVSYITNGGEDEYIEEEPIPQPVEEKPAPAPPAPEPAPAPPVNSRPAPREQVSPPVKEEKIDLKTVKYQSFDDGSVINNLANYEQKNINLLMDVPLQVTVVLGRTKKSIEEILKLNMGSVVVLDRLAGEMVDVHVNGKLFARGEVVVIDDNYGVRITELTEDENLDEYDKRGSKQVLLDMVGS